MEAEEAYLVGLMAASSRVIFRSAAGHHHPRVNNNTCISISFITSKLPLTSLNFGDVQHQALIHPGPGHVSNANQDAISTMAPTTPKIVPAHLSFLAIYNPELGPTDDTFQDQVVFWFSKAAKDRRRQGKQDGDAQKEVQDEENEKLRQIGLAQGMINFAKSFSDDQPVDLVETEKSRIVMCELERGWWILAVYSNLLQ